MNPQEKHASDADTLLRIPFPFSIKKDFLGDKTWQEIKEEARQRHFKISIRGLRKSDYSSGRVEETGMKQQMNIMKLHPGEPIPTAEVLYFYEDLMDTFEGMGLKAHDPHVEEPHHDTSLGTLELFMHGRLVEVSGAPKAPQVTSISAPCDATRRNVTMLVVREPGVFKRWHDIYVLREGARRVSRSPSRRRPHRAPDAGPVGGVSPTGDSPRSESPEKKDEKEGATGWRVPRNGADSDPGAYHRKPAGTSQREASRGRRC